MEIMSKHSETMKLLEKINNIDEECSEFEDLSETEYNIEYNDLLDIAIKKESLEEDNEDVNILNKHRGQKRRFSSGSESDDDDGRVWKEIKEEFKPGRPQVHNEIFKEVAGPTGYAKRHIMKGHVKTAFFLIIDQYMIENIRICTETEAFRVLGTKWELSAAKLDAFIAILYARGAYDAKNLDISYLWNKKWGPAFFSKVMSRNAFTEILRFIRFDKKSQRSQRLQTNKFALISEVWDQFIDNSQNCYTPGAHITVEEQLFPSKARCRFTQYAPKGPVKFGIKFWLASDANSKYIVNGFPYLGKDEETDSSVPHGESAVLKLIEPYTGCGRNVTTDNVITSDSLATKLLAKRTTVGTICGNNRKLSEMARKYSVKSKSRRWPLHVFFNILDLVAINAWILYKETTGENITRQEFLFQLAEELAAEYQESRVKENIQRTLMISSNVYVRSNCQGSYCKGNKTAKICSKCNKYVCGKCTFENLIICRKCNEEE